MNSRTRDTITIADALGRSGLVVASVEVHTPDGRTWAVAPCPAGRGRRPDGSWGPVPGPGGGFRLFEIDRENDDAPSEHDAIDGDTWTADELIDYLRAVGQPKDTTTWNIAEVAQ